MTNPELTIPLEVHGQRLRELISGIETDVEAMESDQLEALLDSCRAVDAQPLEEMDWSVAKIAPLVQRIAAVEYAHRDGRARIREALAL